MSERKRRRVEPPPTLGGKVADARERAGMSQEELARRVGLTAPALRKIERGETDSPRFANVVAIARELGLDLNELGGISRPKPPPATRARAKRSTHQPDQLAFTDQPARTEGRKQ